MIKASSESDDVRGHLQLVLLVPRAAGQLVGSDGFEQLDVEQGQLGGQFVGREEVGLDVGGRR